MIQPSVSGVVRHHPSGLLAVGWPGEKLDTSIVIIMKQRFTLIYDSTAAAWMGISWNGAGITWLGSVRTSTLTGCFVYGVLDLLVWIHNANRSSSE